MRERVIAVAYGTVSHVAFLVAIMLMAYDTYFGSTRALWSIDGEYGRLWSPDHLFFLAVFWGGIVLFVRFLGRNGF